MEVLNSNYLEILPHIIKQLETCAFVSFDAEYTGLKSESEIQSSLFDTMSDRYDIWREVVQSNSAPQFGLTIFHRIDDLTTTNQVYTVDSYCFYLREPCFADFNMAGTKATIEVDCIQFLNHIQFNFNKWFMNAVPYLNKRQVKELEKYLEENPDLMEQCKRNKRTLNKRYFPVYKERLSKEDQKEIVRKLRGFSAIVDVISSMGIPVVGHNMALDLMYFFNNFCDDLPENYLDFKSQVNHFLPLLFDTKYMTIKCRRMLDHPALNHSKDDITHLQCSGLYLIYKTTSSVRDKFSPVFKLLKTCDYFQSDLEKGKEADLENYESSSEETLCHQPSFDSCVTGIVLLHLGHIACRISKEFLKADRPPSMGDIFFHINHWAGQIFMSRATISSMCLKGEDPRPNRAWIRVVYTGAEKYLGNQMVKFLRSDPEIKNLLNGVDVEPITVNQAMLAVARHHTAKEIMEKFKRKGFIVKRMTIPWDKKRWEVIQGVNKNDIYDSRRNKFFY